MIWTLGRGCHGGSALFCSTWRRMGRMGRPCLQRSKSGGRLEAWVCSVGISNGAWLLEPGFRLPNPMLLITWLYFSLHCLHTSAWLWFRKHFCINVSMYWSINWYIVSINVSIKHFCQSPQAVSIQDNFNQMI